MDVSPATPTDLDRLLAEFVVAVETGQQLDVETLCSQNPEHADGIREFFQQTKRLTSSLCADETPIEIEGFQIIREIGRGGMGVVFEAKQESLDRRVAIKVLRDGALSSSQMRARFEKEARLIAQMKHDNIVDVLEYGHVGTRPYLVMPLLEGKALSEQIRNEPLGEKSAARVMIRVAEAIQHAHKAGVVHRDIKPANIVGDESTCQVMDFGLATWEHSDERISRTGDILGTPGYLAPEVLRTKSRGSVATDVYSMGATLYALLIGQAPHKAATPAQSMLLAMNGEPVAPRQINSILSVDINSITQKCLHPNPAKRYSSASAFKSDLQNLLAGKPVTARPVGSFEKVARWAGRNKVLATAIASSLLLLVGLIAGGLYSYFAIAGSLSEQQRLTAVSNSSLQGSVRAIRDFYGKVGNTRALADTPESVALRKELLNDGVVYLNEFLAQNKDNPDLQREVAETYMILADLHARLGSDENETQCAKSAENIFASLLSQDSPPDLRGSYCECLLFLGNRRMQNRKFDEADEYFKKAVAASQSLTALSSTEPETALLSHTANFAVYRNYERWGKAKEALAGGKSALAGFDDLASQNSDNVRILLRAAQVHNWYGIMQHRSGLASAEKTHFQHYTISTGYATDALKLDPSNAICQRQLTHSNGNLALAFQDRGATTPESLAMQQQALSLRRALAEASPSNLRAQIELAEALERMGSMCAGVDQKQQALQYFEESSAITTGLLERIRPTSNYQYWLFLMRVRIATATSLADLAAANGDTEAELKYLREQIKNNTAILEAGENPRVVTALAETFRRVANAHIKTERFKDAQIALSQGIDAYLTRGLSRSNDVFKLRGLLRLAVEEVPAEYGTDEFWHKCEQAIEAILKGFETLEMQARYPIFPDTLSSYRATLKDHLNK